MSGYCEVGSVNMDTMPMITVRMAMTMATMGRRMKNLDMVHGLRLSRRGGSGSRGGLVRGDRSAVSQLLQVVGDHQGAGLDAAFDDPVVAVLRAELHIRHVNVIVRADDVHLLDALQSCTATCGTRMAPRRISVGAADAAELARAQEVPGLGKAAAIRIAPVC